MKTPTLFAFIACFILIASSQAQTVNYKALQGLGEVQYHTVKSDKPAQTYHLFVRLPTDYDSDKRYPTVYLLDGGITFGLLGSYYHYLRFAQEVPEMIIVGISYGTGDWKAGNNRSYDYTAKATERAHWGGAAAFQLLLAGRIIPLIEGLYAVDTAKRMIFGQSLGGQFVLYTAMTKPDLFWGHIASNPALHRNLSFFLKTPEKIASNQSLPRLFVSSGADDDPRFRVPAQKWMKYWQEHTKPPWLLKTKTLEGQSHMSAAPAAFRQGLKWIFSDSPK